MFSEQCYEWGSKRSAIRELFEYGKQRAAVVGEENVYDFSLGNPTVPAPDEVGEAIRDILATETSIQIHGYTSAQGDATVRKAIADYLNQTYGTHFHQDNFYMTCGAAASLCITFHALVESPEDEIIAIAPYFPEYKVFVEGSGAKFVMVEPDMENFQIDLASLDKAVNEHTRAVIVNSPNNPSGVVYTEETIEKVAALLNEKASEFGHPVYLVTDEPYREIVYDGIQVPFVTKYYKDTIVCYSYSKSLSLPGERIGYILVPDEAAESRRLYLSVCGAGRKLGYVCAPSLMQQVVARCQGKVGDINAYKENRDILYDGLRKLGYECVHPDGAFYMFVKAFGGDSEAFCEKAKEFDLLLVAADGFGCPGYVRVSYCVDKEMIERSLGAFAKLAEAYR
ncbi:MAG: pyridoxal phosphate-dependent aminotransferase [Lachnospiraceae bacterium]|nr:pyridoxal phosphate-dependent aminotransferase [Lachnospiraceae bacterium]